MQSENVTHLTGQEPESINEGARALEVLRDLHPDIALGIEHGGEPAPSVISRWTHIAQGKVQLATAIATAALGGRERGTD